MIDATAFALLFVPLICAGRERSLARRLRDPSARRTQA
jgi:hypothetical protein